MKIYTLLLSLFISSFVLLFGNTIFSLPYYTADSGRECDNCHSNPYKTATNAEWKNPALKERKCTLSCATCHINPSGAGLRTVVGRYYAVSTLPANAALNRPEYEKNRSLYALVSSIINKKKQKQATPPPTQEIIKESENIIEKTLVSKEVEVEVDHSKIKHDYKEAKAALLKLEKSIDNKEENGSKVKKEEKEKLIEAKDNLKKVEDKYVAVIKKENESTDVTAKGFYKEDFLSFYAPLNAIKLSRQSKYAFRRDRYGDLNADPFVTIGGDYRFAGLLSSNPKFFPMQLELGTAFHPVEHLTFSSTIGVQGRQAGTVETFTSQNWYVIQNAYVMLHQLPYNGYIQAGLFLPEFGTRNEDHTLYTRSQFEQQPASLKKDNLVYGVQAGILPNYPYLSVSWFSLVDKDLKPLLAKDGTGQGYSVNFAWRGLGWGAGGSVIHKIRNNSDGGNLLAFNVNAYYTLWHFVELITHKTNLRYYLPITFQWDYNVGSKPSDLAVTNSGSKWFAAYTFSVYYLLVNGVSVHFTHSFYDDSFRFKGDSLTKLAAGLDFTVVRSLKLSFEYRRVVQGPTANEYIVFLRGYL